MALNNWCGFEGVGSTNEFVEVADHIFFTREGIVGASHGVSDLLCRTGDDARKGGTSLEVHDAGWVNLFGPIPDGEEHTFGIAVSTNGAGTIMTLGSGFTNVGSWNVAVVRDADNTYKFQHSGSLGTATTEYTWAVPALGTGQTSFCEYQYFELKVVLGTTGSYEFRVDGVTVASNSSVDMNEGGSNNFLVGNTNTGSSTGTRMDDFYHVDSTGSAPYNDFLGPIHIERLYPSGAGSSTDFTPLSGSNHENVDDEGRGDGDTSYNSTSTVGDKDLFTMSDIQHGGSGGLIYSVRHVTQAKKDVAEDNIDLTPIIKTGGTEHDGDQRSLIVSYDYVRKDYEQNPATGSSWTESEVNSLEAGYKSS